ncbi:MAG TPA: molecular chaperone TorD family protein [Methylomirabilota bacterium]|jgi:TorA maturation chaperone TorD|nr:molecular chaperone TorD family protein [Methylomirabilota bacterium]
MIGDRELLGFRQGYYDLLVGLLWREPSDELVRALTAGLGERVQAAGALHRLLGEGWAALARFAADVGPAERGEAVRDEYTRLFLGPGAPELALYESHYLTGRLLDRPLAALRATLAELGIEKQPEYPEPEDFVAFELEVMRCLVRRQGEARDPDGETPAVDAQARFLKRHLLVWGPAAARDLASARAPFYGGVGRLLQGFLALEQDLLREWGPEPLVSLEAARGRYAGRPGFTGRVFEVPSD